MRVKYHGKIFGRDDFSGDLSLPEAFVAEVEALVIPRPEEIEVEILNITPVKPQVTSPPVSSLRSEQKRNLISLMRTVYLDMARAGLEGDSAHREED